MNSGQPIRRAHSRRSRRHRRRSLLLGGGSVATALATILSIGSFSGVDLAGAAVERARSIMDMMSQRSPGERVKGELIKTKHRHYKVLAIKNAPETPTAPLTGSLADVIAPPPAAVPAVVESAPAVAELAPAAKLPPGVVLFPPPGIIAVPCCGAGPPPGTPPPPPGSPPPSPPPPPPAPSPPPPPPPPPPAVPEPGTWMTMILGLGLTGWTLRRQRTVEGQRSSR